MKLQGRTIMELQSLQLNTKVFGGFMGIGTLMVKEDGIAFYKSKGALVGQALFGLIGLAATKNRISGEPACEFSSNEIASAESTGALSCILKVTLKDGQQLRFYTRSRLITGKKDLDRAADLINSSLGRA